MLDDRSSDLTGLSSDSLDELDRLLAEAGLGVEASTRIPVRDPGAPTPMSFSQELVWMLDRATPGMTAYNLPIARRLRGSLDARALQQALTDLAARHEALRTRFADGEGVPVQRVDPAADVTLRDFDLTATPDDRREYEADRLVDRLAHEPIDLATEASFRCSLVRLAPDDHVLLLETHHIVVDGWSLGIMFRELAELYLAARNGRAPVLPALPIQFGDFAAWQRAALAGDRLDELLSFWRKQLGSAANEPLALPTDFARPTTPTFAGARQTVTLSAGQLDAVKRLGQAHDATLYMTLLAGYATVLHRYTGRQDVLIGSGSAARSLPEVQGMVGYVNSTLVQRADFSGDPTFGELLSRVRESAVGAYDHHDMPLEKLVLELRQGQERLSHAPLFEVVLTMQDTIGGGMAFDGLTVEPFGIDYAATKFDVTLLVSERSDELVVTAQYRSDLFAPATMQRFLGHLVEVLTAAGADPAKRVSALPMLTPTETRQLAEWNDTATDEGGANTLHHLFELQAARVGSRIAVVCGGETSMSYSDLNSRANQLANHLGTVGVVANSRVGLLLDRDLESIVGLLGILKSGGAYVPLSVEAPAARLAQQIQEAKIGVVVTVAKHLDMLPATVQAVALDRDAAQLAATSPVVPVNHAGPDSLAYVLFTSGSTGVPKGVAVTHANAVHYTRAISRVLADVSPTAAGDGFSSLDGWHFGLGSTLAADLGNTSLLPSLLAGGTLHLLDKETVTEPSRFAESMRARPLDVLKLTPNHLRALLSGRSGGDLAAVLPRRWMVTGGEALQPDMARMLLGASCRVLNHYGPTETTVGACTFEVTATSVADAVAAGARTVPIGRPLSNTFAVILDPNGVGLPIGVPGSWWSVGRG